jgi:hypothetical protein
VFSHFKIGVDASLLDNLKLLNIHNEKRVAILITLVLENEWDELDLSLHVIQGLKDQVHIVLLWLLLEVNQLLEGHLASKFAQDLLLGPFEVVGQDHRDNLLHLDQRLMVVLAHLLNFFDRLLQEEIVVLPSKLLLLVDQGEHEDVIILGLEIDQALNILSVVVQLDPNVDVTALLALHHHEHSTVILLDPVGELATDVVGGVLDQTLHVGLARDHVLKLLIEVIALTLLLNFLSGDLFAETRDFIDNNQLLLFWQRADLA